jgi:hypothetical protein
MITFIYTSPESHSKLVRYKRLTRCSKSGKASRETHDVARLNIKQYAVDRLSIKPSRNTQLLIHPQHTLYQYVKDDEKYIEVRAAKTTVR